MSRPALIRGTAATGAFSGADHECSSRSAGRTSGNEPPHKLADRAEPVVTPPQDKGDGPQAQPAFPAARLRRVREEGRRQSFPLTGRRVVLGRAADAGLRLAEDGQVSRRHAEVFAERGQWFVRDLNSSNGTLLNGLRIIRSPLRDGDRLELGNTEVRFCHDSAEAVPSLCWTTGDEPVDEVVELTQSRVTVGRREDNDLPLPDARGVSRRHAVFVCHGGKWFVEDLGSRNGTRVNGRSLTERHLLRDGDEIQFGAEVFRFEQVEDEGAARSPAAGIVHSDRTTRYLQPHPVLTFGHAVVPPLRRLGPLGRPRLRRFVRTVGALFGGAAAGFVWGTAAAGRGGATGASRWLGCLPPAVLGGAAAAVLAAFPTLAKRLTVAPYLRVRRRSARAAAHQRMRRVEQRLEERLAVSAGDGTAVADLLALRLLQGDLRSAQELLTRSGSENGLPASLHNNRGVTLARTGHLPAALEEFAAAAAAGNGDPRFRANLGRAQLLAGQIPAAVQTLTAAVTADPRNAALHAVLGVALFQSGRMPEAEEALRTAVSLNNACADAANDLGLVHHVQGRFADSVHRLRQAARTAPGQAWIRANLAVSRLVEGEVQPALRELTAARRLSAEDPVIRNNLALVRFAAGAGTEAERELESAAAGGLLPFACLYNLATIRWLRKRHELAGDLLEQAVRRGPQQAASRHNLGCVHLHAGRLEAAEEQFRAALSAEPDNPATLSNLGITLLSAGRSEEALPLLNQAAEKAPAHPAFQFNAAYGHHVAGNAEQALTAYQRLLDDGHHLPEVYANLGLCHYHLGALDLAVNYLKAALARNPDLHTAPLTLGRVCCERGDLTTALGYLQTAQKDEPLNPDVYRNLGVAYYRRKQFDEATRAFVRAVQLVPRQLTDQNNLGLAYAKRGRPDAAIRHFQRALEFDPDDVPAHSNLGLCYYLTGHIEAAMKQWQRVSELSPKYAAARGEVRQAEFDDANLAFTSLDWQARAVRLPPVVMGLRYHLSLSECCERWELSLADSDLDQARDLLRRGDDYDGALRALLAAG